MGRGRLLPLGVDELGHLGGQVDGTARRVDMNGREPPVSESVCVINSYVAAESGSAAPGLRRYGAPLLLTAAQVQCGCLSLPVRRFRYRPSIHRLSVICTTALERPPGFPAPGLPPACRLSAKPCCPLTYFTEPLAHPCPSMDGPMPCGAPASHQIKSRASLGSLRPWLPPSCVPRLAPLHPSVSPPVFREP